MTKTRIALVGCASQKLGRPAPARDLYVSDLFRKASAYAEAVADDWFVLSAKHGLVKPDEVLEPYDTKLGSSKTGPVIHAWAERVADQLEVELALRGLPFADVELVLLAGAHYGTFVYHLHYPLADNVTEPLKGLGIGQRKSWLKAQLEDAGVDLAKPSTRWTNCACGAAPLQGIEGELDDGIAVHRYRECNSHGEIVRRGEEAAPAPVVEAPAAVVELEELAVTNDLRREVYAAGHAITEASRSAAGGNRDLTVDRLLATALEAERRLEDLKAKLVLELRAGGASWTAIAGRLGVSKQAAAKRYGPLEWEALRTELRSAR